MGEGKFANVLEVRRGGAPFAAKVIDKSAVDSQFLSWLPNEIALLGSLNHPNIGCFSITVLYMI